jgi:hypothetical protein
MRQEEETTEQGNIFCLFIDAVLLEERDINVVPYLN